MKGRNGRGGGLGLGRFGRGVVEVHGGNGVEWMWCSLVQGG